MLNRDGCNGGRNSTIRHWVFFAVSGPLMNNNRLCPFHNHDRLSGSAFDFEQAGLHHSMHFSFLPKDHAEQGKGVAV